MIEEKTIERCEELIKPEHANWIGISNQEAIRGLLNMLKEKDKEINRKSSAINALQCALHERTEERDRKDYIIARQKKQIDLMAEQLEGVPINKNISNFEQPNLKECITIFTNKEDVKQYYESKAIF